MIHDAGDFYSILPTTIRPRRIQPGKKTILVSVLLSFMLLMSQLLRALQLDQPPRLSNVHIMNSLTSLNEEVEVPTCINTELGSEDHHHGSNPQACHHLPAPRGLCSLTQALFFSNKPQSCKEQSSITFCRLVEDQILCQSPLQCKDLRHYIGTFNEEEADTTWKSVSINELQNAVISEIQKENYFGYMFIKCSNSSGALEDFGQPQYDEAYADQNFDSYTQLFVHPKKIHESQEKPKKDKRNININLVMIDSLSRTHFYRSLPKTVRFLDDLYDELHSKVLDFHYFQAVKQRTYESLQALFSGYVNMTEVPFGTYDVPKKPLPVSELFGKYKMRGFKTLWLEDLCWSWEWGLVKDLKVMNDSLSGVSLWKEFKRALSVANIDSVDMTLASCEILQANGKKDPFHGLPAVCYNSRHHHEYILEYLELYQRAALKAGQSFLTFTSSSVSHDASGIRVQTIDEPLVKYLKFASKMKNTITILFADHGNTYGNFIKSSPEAHVETFNPALFMIIPQDVQDQLGDVQMRILRDNQRRLISAIDIHYMLLGLINEKSTVPDKKFVDKYVTPMGLLSSISVTKNCLDVPLLQPNLCICRNFEVSVEPSHLHLALADFGLGVLNNLILSQHKEGGGTGFGNCRPLKPVRLRKVLESRVRADLVRYKLDVIVQGLGEGKEIDQEIFFLTIEVGPGEPALRLVAYERMTLYGIYSKCQDKNVELKMCICNHSSSRGSEVSLLSSLLFGNFIPEFSFLKKDMKDSADLQVIEFLTSPVFGITPRIGIVFPSDNPCLFTVIHNYNSGFVLISVNLCSSMHKIEVEVNADNLYLSGDRHLSVLLHPNDIKFITAGTVANAKNEWQWTHSVRVF
ncbi:uncharacterized protein [Penaeus vannamei]|uniref:uncharacterized protein n=1 Tax=Penaeus vannamei TaxID=6689 RepID=UPI00387F4C80